MPAEENLDFVTIDTVSLNIFVIQCHPNPKVKANLKQTRVELMANQDASNRKQT